jgi:carbonic anhydrase
MSDAARTFDDLLEANRAYTAGFSLAGVPARAAKGFALVTCMDSRIEPLVMLGLRPGDAKIMRNAGGRTTPDVLRSLVLAVTFLGVERIAVMHHTDCAMAGRDEAAVHAALDPARAPAAAGWDFLTMGEPDVALTRDVDAVRNCPVLPPGLAVEGWRYDVGTGAVARVVPV